MDSPSDISIKLDGVEISDRVVYSQSQFTSQANPIQGTFKLVIRDPDQDFAPVAGQKVSLHIDGVPLFGGYVFRIGRGNFFPAADTSSPSTLRSRRWILEGPDFNVLWDKRVLRNEADYASALEVPVGKRTISKAFKYLMNNFVDVPAGLDFTTHVDVIDTMYGTDENGGLYVGQSKTLREQMDDFADNGAVLYYIDADFAVHLHEYEALLSPWTFVDVPANGVTTVAFREGEYEKDFSNIATEALVWGGSSLRRPDGPGGDIVFAKYPDPPANDATWYGRLQSAEREQKAIDRMAKYGRWQIGEERAGQNNYLTLGSVKNRAFVIINGPPGTVPTHGIESGLSKPTESMRAVWFAHDVPSGLHIRPGYIQNFILYSQGEGSSPLVTMLPCRSMRVSFPARPTSGTPQKTYVRFEGEFGTSFSDSRHLWKYLRKSKGSLGSATSVIDNNSEGVPPGSLATVWPSETANGTRTSFTYPYTFYQDQFDLFLNGLFQRPGIDFTYNAATKQVTFLQALQTGDQQWAIGYVS